MATNTQQTTATKTKAIIQRILELKQNGGTRTAIQKLQQQLN